MISCQQSENTPDYHFAGAGKPITGGKGAVQVVDDYHLSRFVCYLIAQNGDPRKQEIARIREPAEQLARESKAEIEAMILGTKHP